MADPTSSDVPDPEMLAALTEAVDEVRDELAGLRRVVDEIRDDLAWAARNNSPDDWRVIQPITSMPLDPLASDWSARLNRFTSADLPSTSPAVSRNGNGQVPPLHVECGDDVLFCCEQPKLCWEGERENATIFCASCTFVLADDGQLGDWRDPEQIAWEREFIEAEGDLEKFIADAMPPENDEPSTTPAPLAQRPLF